MNPVTLKRSFDENPQEEYTSKKVKYNPPSLTSKCSRETLSDVEQPPAPTTIRRRVKVVATVKTMAIEDPVIDVVGELIAQFSRMQISEPQTNVEQTVLAPIDSMKFWVEALWADNDLMVVEENSEIELTCSLLLQKTLTDAQLEHILKKSDPEKIKKNYIHQSPELSLLGCKRSSAAAYPLPAAP